MVANTPVNAISSLSTPTAKEVRQSSSSSISSSSSSSSSSGSSAKVMSSEADKSAHSRKRSMSGDYLPYKNSTHFSYPVYVY